MTTTDRTTTTPAPTDGSADGPTTITCREAMRAAIAAAITADDRVLFHHVSQEAGDHVAPDVILAAIPVAR